MKRLKTYVTLVWASLSIGLGAAAVAAAPMDLDWFDMPDPAAQTFDDPFVALPYYQLDELALIAGLRDQLAADGLTQEARARITEREADAVAALRADGVDADALLAQRWEVGAKRELAARAPNPALTGVEVRVAGFAIGAPNEADGTNVAYLVPEPGMCSHVPPPMPNQMIRLRLPDDWQPDALHEPVVITGTLHPEASQREIFVADGLTLMEASYTLDVVEIVPFMEAWDAMQEMEY